MELHVTVDFNDDLWYAERPWDEAALRGMVRHYAARGIAAIHWLEQGGIADGMHDRGGYLDRLGTAWEFIQRVPDPLAVVADEARRAGMRCYAVIKVNDLALGMPWSSLPPGDPRGPAVGLPCVGGYHTLAHRWHREHPGLRAELHPALVEREPRRPLAAVRLWHEAAGLPAPRLRLLASDDNRRWRPVAGAPSVADRPRRAPRFVPAPERAFEPERSATCVEWRGLDLAAPFLAVEAEAPTQLANTLAALAELEDVAGEPAAFTYGLGPIKDPDVAKPDWRDCGIAFDGAYGTPVPGRGWTHVESGGRHRVDLAAGFLGLARGRNRWLTGVVELAWPETRAWVVGMAERAIAVGCHGVDLRMNTHTESLDWENYGFSEPILAEFRRRHGVDPAREPFDRQAWRELRGEQVDRLVAEVSGAVRARGGRMSVQVMDEFERRAPPTTFHEIAWHWRSWLDDGHLDVVNLAKCSPRDPAWAAVVGHCRRRGVPLMLTGGMNWASAADVSRDTAVYREVCPRDGIGTFNLYEGASLVRLGRDGFRDLCPLAWTFG